MGNGCGGFRSNRAGCYRRNQIRKTPPSPAGVSVSVWHKRDSAALKLFCGVFPMIQRTFEAEEELLNLATPDVRRGDPQEAHSTAAVRLPTPPIQFLGSYTVRQKRQLPARTALYPEGERLSLESPRHGGAASRPS